MLPSFSNSSINFKILWRLFLPLLFCTAQSYSQVKNLLVNSTSNIIKLNTLKNPATVSYTGINYGFEGIAHTEDSTGRILFFVNADGVYGANGEVMKGSDSIYADPSNAEIDICPVPGKSKQYYILYNKELCSSLYYSIVDMSLNNGLGGILAVNTLIDNSPMAEGLELIKVPCKRSYWLIGYSCESGFKRYLVNEDGISKGQLIYPISKPAMFLGRGELDYHNGKLGIAFANCEPPVAFLCDFDADSGSISNGRTIGFRDGGKGVYGLEFSPDATKAYLTEWYNDYKDNLFQYDFETGKITNFTISSEPGREAKDLTGPGQIELGADGKLYIPYEGGNQIIVIDDANSTSPTISAITTGSLLSLGISDHIQSEITKTDNNFTYKNICSDETTQFRFIPGSCATSTPKVTWNFGDQKSKRKNQSNDLLTAHHFTKEGKYKVTLYVQSPFRDTISHTVTISRRPAISLKDSSFCFGDTIILDAGISGMSYRWSTGEFTKQTKVYEGGTYSLAVDNNGCIAENKAAMHLLPKPEIALGEDKYICDGPLPILDAGKGGTAYLWNTGQTSSQITALKSGVYAVQVSNKKCSSYDTVEITIQPSAHVNLGNDTVLCKNQSILLNAGNDGDSYLWSTGETNNQLKVNKAGNYSVEVSKGACLSKDNIQVRISDSEASITMPDSVIIAKQTTIPISTDNTTFFHVKITDTNNRVLYESSSFTDKCIFSSKELEQLPSPAMRYTVDFRGECDPHKRQKRGTIRLI